MHVALAVAFGSILVAPFIGRWRANVWLQKNVAIPHHLAKKVVEIA